MSTKRTRLRPVYLTDTERDLVVSALEVLKEDLSGGSSINAVKFAKSYTARRIEDVRTLLVDKPQVEVA